MSTNVSKEKRNLLIKKIEDIKTFIQSSPQDDNTAQLLAYISDIEKDIKGKKYGLVFEEHREGIDELLENNLPVLTEDTDLFIDNGGQMNFLIEGDNLASLKLLEKTHKGRIDLIYIDPPYNTGNKDFVYDDSFVDSNDTFRHSKWLSFMEKRLQIARSLLSENGVIFISIDDNEQSALKMLCDSIFNENNFIAKFDWRKKTGANDAKDIAVVTESILLYGKNKTACMETNIWARDIDSIDKGRYKYEDEFADIRGKFYYDTLDRGGLQYSDSMNYGITMPDGALLFPNGRSEFVNDGWIWKWGKEKVRWGIENKFIEFCKSKKKSHTAYTIKYKVYENVDNDGNIRDKTGRAYMNLITSPINQQGNSEMKELFDGKSPFSNPKPVGLLLYLIKTIKLKHTTILDFFAGSGTTGHAVMKLNVEDGGSRKFILCTNNENNICRDVTYERIKRVIAKDDYKASLKYFKVEYLPISDKLYYEYADELLLHIRELVELENGINFNGNTEIAIVLTEKELDEFTQNIPETCKAIYVGHNVLPTEEQEKIFAKRKIKVNVIPEYYYRDLEG